MKKYFPILLSKAGETKALTRLKQDVKDEITPVIQLLTEGYDRIETFAIEEWSFDDNELFLDFSLCEYIDRVRTRRLFSNLSNGGVNVVPVLQSNSDATYLKLVQSLVAKNMVKNVCLRFSNGSGGFININGQIATIMNSLSIKRNQTSVLLDFGLVEDHNYNMISASAVNIISSIDHKQAYKNIIIASSSFLENLSTLTPPGKLYRLQRYEWDIWQTLIAQTGFAEVVKYGDYGTKYPYYAEANFQGSCSIKYTRPKEFIVYRGEISSNHPEGNGQYIIFADQLVKSSDFSGANFSWGDSRIDFYSKQLLSDPSRKTGNATTWVEISQNHHITLLHSLL